MKFILIVLQVLAVADTLSQNMQINIRANNKSITVSPYEENGDKLFVMQSSSTGNKFLKIYITNDSIAKDWKRSFSIYDSAGNAITDFIFMKDGSYCVKISNPENKLIPQQNYFVYTIALPVDPNKAMTVKVARKLVCRIKIL